MLSAASENVNMLLRALAENHRMEVLQRPQIMALDNNPAFVQVGQRVPYVMSSQVNIAGTTYNTQLIDVGLVLRVQPRISPDGLVVMLIDAVKSTLENPATGIPVNVTSTGEVIRSPIIDNTEAYTTVSAMSGQTVVLGGLIDKQAVENHRKVPLLGDVPVFGHLFRYDSTTNSRTELLIIMTPHIVKTEAEADAIKQAEAARMSWCMCDVTTIYGEAGLRKRSDNWSNAETQVIYPDLQPSAPATGAGPESVPRPAAVPQSDGREAPMPPGAPLLEPAQPRGARTVPDSRRVDMRFSAPPPQAAPAGYVGGTVPAQPAVYQQAVPRPQYQAGQQQIQGNYYR